MNRPLLTSESQGPTLCENTTTLSATTDAPRKPTLTWSCILGPPSFVLDPEDMKDAPKWKKNGPAIHRADEDTIVKYGIDVSMAEAEAMHFVAENTSISCPKVLAAYVLDDIPHIVMSYEPHTPLPVYWNKASEEERENVISQLKDAVQQMRALKGTFIGGLNKSPCVDGMFQWDHRGCDIPYGPFSSIEDFNEGIVQAWDNTVPPTRPRDTDPESVGFNASWEFTQMIRSLKGYDIVFTHGDLHPGNIGVRKDGSIVLFDWQTAGFWPEYWEFYKAIWHGGTRPDYIRQIERYVPPYYKEAFIMSRIYDKMTGFAGP